MLIRSLDDYGGPIANYAPVKDPTTDEDCKFRNRYACDLAMLTHTGAVALVSFVGVNGGNPTDPTGFVHDARWGSSNPVKPTVVRTGEGVWTVTYASTFNDELTLEDPSLGGGATISTNFRRANASTEPLAGVLTHARATVTSPNVVTVYGFLANGTADDLTGVTITAWIW